MVKMFTSRLTYEGQDKIDATVKTGQGRGRYLAPTWPLVAGHKLYEARMNGDPAEIERWSVNKITGAATTPLNEEQYTEQYIALLRQRYIQDKQPFLDILAGPQATITCFCGVGKFCHRHIAVDVLEKIARHHNIPFERGGEIDPRTGHTLAQVDNAEYQSISFNTLPIIATNGETPLGYAATAVIRQQDSRAMLEVAHFPKHSKDRADEYIGQLQANLKARGYKLKGGTSDIESTVGWLTRQAITNRLSGEWNPLTREQGQQLIDGDLGLVHSFHEMKPISGYSIRDDFDYDY